MSKNQNAASNKADEKKSGQLFNSINNRSDGSENWNDIPDSSFVNLCAFHVPDKPLNLQVTNFFQFIKYLNLNLKFYFKELNFRI